jgi:hypothetical protein
MTIVATGKAGPTRVRWSPPVFGLASTPDGINEP